MKQAFAMTRLLIHLTAACALVEPDVILSYRDRHDAATRETVSRLIAAALSNQSVSPSRASRTLTDVKRCR